MGEINLETKLNRKSITAICNILKLILKLIVIATVIIYVYGLISSFQFFMNSITQLKV